MENSTSTTATNNNMNFQEAAGHHSDRATKPPKTAPGIIPKQAPPIMAMRAGCPHTNRGTPSTISGLFVGARKYHLKHRQRRNRSSQKTQQRQANKQSSSMTAPALDIPRKSYEVERLGYSYPRVPPTVGRLCHTTSNVRLGRLSVRRSRTRSRRCYFLDQALSERRILPTATPASANAAINMLHGSGTNCVLNSIPYQDPWSA
jgi:hypothetical protein